VNTRKKFALEILMTMAPIINERVTCLSFRLEDDDQLVLYEHIRELLEFRKDALEQVDIQENVLEGFW
jgi:hypothetical protein